MTLPAYSGRHSVFDATTVIPVPPARPPQAPPAGAPPGPVRAAFGLAVAQALCALAGAGVFALILMAVSLDRTEGVVAAVLVIGVTALTDVGWLWVAWHARAGNPAARTVLAVLTALGLLVAAFFTLVAWTVLVPLAGLAVQTTMLVLLFSPTSNAWFRAVALSRVPGPGSPPR